jgi:hypothetical protein
LINCADFIAEIGNYLEGEVAEEIRASLEHHLKHCQTCTVLLDSTRKTLKIVTETGSFDLDAAEFAPVAQRIMSKIREGAK